METRLLLVCLAGTALIPPSSSSGTTPTLWFADGPAAASSSDSNDLLTLARQMMPSAVRTGSLDQIIAGASDGDAVLVLAHGYPWRHTDVPATLLAAARKKRLHLYMEYLQDLPSFNRRKPPHESSCLNTHAKLGGQVTTNITTTVRSLCACEGPGAAPSTLRYTGRVCGAASSPSLLWERMENLSPCHDCATKTCEWSATNQTDAWTDQFTGSCGVAPSLLPELPTHICGAVPRPAPPPPPSTVSQVSWKKRAVVTTDAAASLGLAIDTILLPQGAYTNGWCADESCAAAASPSSSLSSGCAEACNASILAFAKVAGVYKAVYGVPKSIQQPILFEHRLTGPADAAAAADRGGGDVPPALVATTKLSNFVSGRFGPTRAWHSLWVYLLTKLGVRAGIAQQLPVWNATVGPAYSNGAALSSDAVSAALEGHDIHAVFLSFSFFF
jgi:hypothetical protein